MKLLDSASYLGVFLLVFLGEAGLPMFAPVELALIAAGVRYANEADVLGAMAALTLAADVLGSVCLFRLARAAMTGKRVPGFWRRRVTTAGRLAARFGARDPRRVAAGRSVPFLRVPAAGAAALAGLPLKMFVVCALAGGMIWTTTFLGGAALVTRLTAG